MTIAATRPGAAPVPPGGAPNGTAGGRPGRALTAVYVAGAVTALGTQMTMLALPWLVLETTGSATRAGLVFAAQVLPMALLGFAGGEVIQRLGARRTMVVSDLARAPVVALIPLLQTLGALNPAVLVAIVAALGALAVPYHAAQRVLAMELLSPHARSLARVNSALEGVQNGSAFAGPALAGALIPLVGTTSVVWLDAATFAFSGLLLLRRVPAGGGGAGGSAAGPRGMWAGVRHLCGDWFLSRAMLSTVVFGLMLRTLMITMPVLAFARFEGDARVGGLLIAALGAGGLVGSVAAYVLAARVAPVRLACTALVCVALPLWTLLVPVPARRARRRCRPVVGRRALGERAADGPALRPAAGRPRAQGVAGRGHDQHPGRAAGLPGRGRRAGPGRCRGDPVGRRRARDVRQRQPDPGPAPPPGHRGSGLTWSSEKTRVDEGHAAVARRAKDQRPGPVHTRLLRAGRPRSVRKRRPRRAVPRRRPR
ncbi:MFS transporter [Streptomyces werraensis]|nr:MFS transporter [Streptomyces werraensis]